MAWLTPRDTARQLGGLYRPSSATTVSRTPLSDFSNSVDRKMQDTLPPPEYTPARPRYHDLENTISRGTPTTRPVQSTNRIQLNADHSLSHTTTVLKVGLCRNTSRPRTLLVSHTELGAATRIRLHWPPTNN